MSLPRIPVRFGTVGAARLAVYLAFFNLGAGNGLWAVFIPVVRARIGIDEGVLGLVLLAIAAGAMIAMPATGWAIARFGSHALSPVAAMAMPVVAALPIVAPSLPLLFLAALLLGAANGTLDVAMNNEAGRVETARGRPSMSAFHGFYSIGGLAGAGMGGLLVGLGSGAAWAAAGVLVVLAVAAVFVRDWYLPATGRPVTRFRFTLPSRALVGLGLLAFLCFGLEGAVGDWSALFLTSERAASPAIAAAGYGAFAAGMAMMRLLGDRLVGRFGRARALVAGGIVVAIGCTIALTAPWPFVSAAGFGLVGVGAANVVPVIFSTATRFPAGSGGVAAVSTIGYIGLLLWPPVIGGLARLIGLPLSLWLIAFAGLAIAARGRLVRAA